MSKPQQRYKNIAKEGWLMILGPCTEEEYQKMAKLTDVDGVEYGHMDRIKVVFEDKTIHSGNFFIYDDSPCFILDEDIKPSKKVRIFLNE
jgi:hypothetical protein